MDTEAKIQVRYIDIKVLRPAEYNPRQLTDKQFKDLSESIKRFGLKDPLIVNQYPARENIIIGGHQRWNIAQKLGYTEVPVVFVNLPPEKEQELNLRLNKNLGSWDIDLLANFNEDLLKDVGFDSEELDKIFQLDKDEEADDVPEVRQETDVKLGDIYLLGNHRLMCGDATKKEDVEKLMAGQKADMVFHSPPYNVGHNLGYKTTSKYISSDDNLPNYQDLIKYSTLIALDIAKEVFVNIQLLANNKREILRWLGDLSGYFKDIFYWKKLQVAPAMAENVANSQVEVIILLGKENSRRWGNKRFRGNFSNYIETDSASRENINTKIHNATYPLELPLRFIDHGYNYGSIVVDLFAGTGTTAIACEKTNRKCYMMEIDPLYCQVIIDRWEKYTNLKAEKI